MHLPLLSNEMMAAAPRAPASQTANAESEGANVDFDTVLEELKNRPRDKKPSEDKLPDLADNIGQHGRSETDDPGSGIDSVDTDVPNGSVETSAAQQNTQGQSDPVRDSILSVDARNANLESDNSEIHISPEVSVVVQAPDTHPNQRRMGTSQGVAEPVAAAAQVNHQTLTIEAAILRRNGSPESSKNTQRQVGIAAAFANGLSSETHVGDDGNAQTPMTMSASGNLVWPDQRGDDPAQGKTVRKPADGTTAQSAVPQVTPGLELRSEGTTYPPGNDAGKSPFGPNLLGSDKAEQAALPSGKSQSSTENNGILTVPKHQDTAPASASQSVTLKYQSAPGLSHPAFEKGNDIFKGSADLASFDFVHRSQQAAPTATANGSVEFLSDDTSISSKLARPRSGAHAMPVSDQPLQPLDTVAEETVWEVRARPASAVATQTGHASRPELPPHIVHSLTEALNRSPDKAIEIALSPAELGRVRMLLTTSEGVIVVNILAERSETLDLMRRNIDDLGRSFSELGYENISFAFGKGGDADDMQDQRSGAKAEGDTVSVNMDNAATPRNLRQHNLAVTIDGVDMRV